MEDWGQFTERFDFPPYPDRPRTYLIASLPRTGSYYLAHLLIGTRRAGVPIEYLQPTRWVQWHELLGTTSTRDTFEALFRRRTSPNGLFGIKAHFAQVERSLTPEDWRSLAFGRVIRLSREDVCAQAVSGYFASKSGEFTSLHTAATVPEYDFAAIYDRYRAATDERRAWGGLLAEQAPAAPVLEIEYEDLLATPLETLNRCLAHLGEAPADTLPEVPIERQTDDLKAEYVDRFRSELAGYASGIPYKGTA